ncbi:site-specific integrase [Flavobacteriales bacterium]|nr:site-specific integrase [Flavobacteriales bacterium]
MSKIYNILQTVHSTVHSTMPTSNFTNPSIYPKIIEDKKLTSFSKKKKKELLKVQWYIRYSFRNPQGIMTRQPNDKFKINKTFKNFDDRYNAAHHFRNLMEQILKDGYNPYSTKSFVKEDFHSVERSIDFALELKLRDLADSSIPDYKSKIEKFKNYLENNGYLNKSIKKIDRKIVVEFLNEVSKQTSARTRNNVKVVISAIFTVLVENYRIEHNFVAQIKNLKTSPEKNKAYTQDEVDGIFKHLEENEKHDLLRFIKVSSFNFLRPIEVCRLKLKDVDLINKRLYVRAKNKPLKLKLIPEILIIEFENAIKEIDYSNPESYIFAKKGSISSPESRRSNYTRRYSRVKNLLNFGYQYTLYSFRHTFITKLYTAFRKKYSKTETIDKLMLITGHLTLQSLIKYLRDIDVEIAEDYSGDL